MGESLSNKCWWLSLHYKEETSKDDGGMERERRCSPLSISHCIQRGFNFSSNTSTPCEWRIEGGSAQFSNTQSAHKEYVHEHGVRTHQANNE